MNGLEEWTDKFSVNRSSRLAFFLKKIIFRKPQIGRRSEKSFFFVVIREIF